MPTSFVPCWVHTPPLRVNTHAAPKPLLSSGPPMTAVLPSADTATDSPCTARSTAPVPTSFVPCWVHTPPLRVNTHAAPKPLLSPRPPTTTVFPSADRSTETPCIACPTAPVPTSFVPCWIHTPPLRVNTHAAPAFPSSLNPLTTTVFPSADTATEVPCLAGPTAPVPTSFVPCWVHTPPLRVHTHAAPVLLLSPGPPTTAVFPSADTATDDPCTAGPTAPVPTSLVPCCPNCAPALDASIRKTSISATLTRTPCRRRTRRNEPIWKTSLGGRRSERRTVMGAALLCTAPNAGADAEASGASLRDCARSR